MFGFFANIFGYVLAFLYNIVNNYGLAIILFTVIVKLCLLPLSIKQQRTLKKNTELQEKMKVIQFKYKNDPEKMNQEIMNLYRSEKMSPFSRMFNSNYSIITFIISFLFSKKSNYIYAKNQ